MRTAGPIEPRMLAGVAASAGLAAVLMAALNMRVGIAQVGPVIEDVRADTGMSSSAAGLLGTIPFVSFGLFAFAGAPLLARVGARRTVVISLWLVAAGTLARAATLSPAILLLGTIPLGIGIALLGVALPTVIKQRFSDRAAGVTGLYIASMATGAAAAAVVTVPMADALGGWRPAFALFVLVPLAALPLWTGARGFANADAGADAPAERRTLRRPGGQALLLAATFGLQGIAFSAMINWIAAVYVEEGWSEQQAALTTTGLPLLTIVASLAMPVVTSAGSRPFWILATGLGTTAGLTGIAIAPTTLPLLWLLLAGWGIAAIFPLVMMLPLDLRATPAGVAQLTGWMLGAGYLLSAVGPTLVGALRDATGGFTVPVLVVAGCALAAALLALAPPLRRRPAPA